MTRVRCKHCRTCSRCLRLGKHRPCLQPHVIQAYLSKHISFRRMHLQLFQLTIWISCIVLHRCSVVIKRAVGMPLLYKLHSCFPCLEDQQNNLRYHAQTHMTGTPHGQWRRQVGCFGCCTVHLVYILPEVSGLGAHCLSPESDVLLASASTRHPLPLNPVYATDGGHGDTHVSITEFVFTATCNTESETEDDLRCT